MQTAATATSLHSINPALWAAAELLTDGRVTDAHLRMAAARWKLPLTAQAPAVDLAAQTVRETAEAIENAQCALREARRLYEGACQQLGQANRRVLKGGRFLRDVVLSPERVQANKSNAFRALNASRARLRAAERRLASLQQGA